MKTLLIVLVAVAALAGCNTAAGMRQDTRQAVDYTYEKREEYQRKLGSELREIDARMDELKAKAARSSQSVKTEFARDMDELGRHKAVLNEKLDSVKASPAAAWNDVKAGADSAMASVKRTYEKARARFQ